MKNEIRLLLAVFCLLSFETGCTQRLEKTDDPDTGKNNAEVRTNKETQQADSLKDAEKLARTFVDAMNRFFETDFEPMRQLKKDGFISDPLWAILERAIQSGGKGKVPVTAALSFNRNEPEKDRVVFEVLLRERFPEGDFETSTILLELKKPGSQWIVSNNGRFSETRPYDIVWEVVSPEKTVEGFFAAYQWIPREDRDAIVFCSLRATDEWLMNSQWKIGEKLPDDTNEGSDRAFNGKEKEWSEKSRNNKWVFSPAISPKDTDIVWKRIRIDDVDLPGRESVSPEFSRQSLANLPYEEEHALLDELMKGAIVSVSFLDDRDETLFQRKFLLRPLNPKNPVWVIVGER